MSHFKRHDAVLSSRCAHNIIKTFDLICINRYWIIGSGTVGYFINGTRVCLRPCSSFDFPGEERGTAGFIPSGCTSEIKNAATRIMTSLL